jgi:hypothetical protein
MTVMKKEHYSEIKKNSTKVNPETRSIKANLRHCESYFCQFLAEHAKCRWTLANFDAWLRRQECGYKPDWTVSNDTFRRQWGTLCDDEVGQKMGESVLAESMKEMYPLDPNATVSITLSNDAPEPDLKCGHRPFHITHSGRTGHF